MSNTTRAAIQIASGDPLIIGDLDLPEPRPDQVALQLFSSGICHTQIHELTDTRPRPITFGHEGAALVTQVGSEVTRVRAAH